MRKLILHIGTHKTGTSSIQSFLAKNASAIGEQGICVPRLGGSGDPGYNKNRNGHCLMLGASCATRPAYRARKVQKMVLKDLKRLIKKTEGYDTAILTDERFWFEGAMGIDYWIELKSLVEVAGFDTVELIVYLRRQDQLLNSVWRQFIKKNEQHSIAQFYRREDVYQSLDYLNELSEIESVFGAGSVKVRLFDRKEFAGGDLYHDFCEAAGIEWTADLVIPKQELNQSLTDTVAEVKRWANVNPKYYKSSNFLRAPASHVASMYENEKGVSIIGPQLYAELRATHEQDNQALADKYLGGHGGCLVNWPEYEGREWSAVTQETLQVVVQVFAEAMAVQESVINNQQKRIAKLEKAYRINAKSKRKKAKQAKAAPAHRAD